MFFFYSKTKEKFHRHVLTTHDIFSLSSIQNYTSSMFYRYHYKKRTFFLYACGYDATAYLIIISSFIDLLAKHWFRRHHQNPSSPSPKIISHTFLPYLHNSPSRWRQLWGMKNTRIGRKKKKIVNSAFNRSSLVKIMQISKLHKKSQTYHAICSIFSRAKTWSIFEMTFY